MRKRRPSFVASARKCGTCGEITGRAKPGASRPAAPVCRVGIASAVGSRRGRRRDPLRGRREPRRALGALPLPAAVRRVRARALHRAEVDARLRASRPTRWHASRAFRLPAGDGRELRARCRARPRRGRDRALPGPRVGGLELLRARPPALRARIPRARVDRLRGHRRQHGARAGGRRGHRGRALGARLRCDARPRRSCRRSPGGRLGQRSRRRGPAHARDAHGPVAAQRAASPDGGARRVPAPDHRAAPAEVRGRRPRLDRLVAHR